VSLELSRYPLNTWYVIASSNEVRAALGSCNVLDRKIALYRKRNGEIAALDDRCSHRAMSLTLGSVVDDAVVCAYHGFTFGSDGRCLRVPSQENVPYGADVRSYRVFEDGPFVWLWPGERAQAEQLRPPKLPWLQQPGWTTFGGVDVVAANYLLLHENALDRAHFPFVHSDTSHAGYLTQPPPLQVEVTETTVSYARSFPPGPLTTWQAAATGLAMNGHYVQRERGEFVSPGLHIDVMEIEAPVGSVTAPLHEDNFRTVFVRGFTPLREDSTLVTWRVARNYALEDRSVTQGLRFIHETSMAEDKPFLEDIQANRSAGDDRIDIDAAADSAALRAQQIVARMLLEERGSFRPRPKSRQQQVRKASPVAR
jgi:phenylpropionate dioxygenase-like ring-hydroxylating dioxygenase large terminal subunit